jgi:hypothetical protein
VMVPPTPSGNCSPECLMELSRIARLIAVRIVNPFVNWAAK